ncbi:MAG: exonuclease domain-containing protein [Woeseiaceae bacterium]
MFEAEEFDQTKSSGRRPRKELPPFYYHQHFLEMLAFLEKNYSHVFESQHRDFLAKFHDLDRRSQALYVRLINRKGRVFAIPRLRYPEIGAVTAPLNSLRAAGFVDAPGSEHYDEVLHFLTKAEILTVLTATLAGVPRSAPKRDLVTLAQTHCAPADFMACLKTSRIIVQRRVDEVRYLLFLYFGRIREGMDRFTMRDLGLVRAHDFKSDYEARFQEIDEAREHYYFAARLHQARSKAANESLIDALTTDSANWPEPVTNGAARLRDKLADALGKLQEQRDNIEVAIGVYSRGEAVRCTERAIRLMVSTGRRDDAKKLLERCMESPRSEEEATFAHDFYSRKFDSKRTTLATDVLRAAATITVDEAYQGAPERAAVAWFKDQGQRAFRVENALWRTFFGLLFWDALFTRSDAELHSPFDSMPRGLKTGTFYADNADLVESRLALLQNPARLKLELLQVSTQHFGVHNGVFRWRQRILDALFAFVDAMQPEAAQTVLRQISRHYPDMRYGYPDLLVLDDDGPRFVEIKAEGDQLRRNQLVKIGQLQAAGFRAEVMRVRWALDPHQTYVVVDVETTGGRGEQHRVTEIGAVKVQGGKVTDRFSTLLNPERAIPASITRLTGITPEMVASAPRFSEIADEFAEFLGDAIFVAHNVAFDYRFISQEFRRLGRPFRLPRLCTVAGMRRFFPGHSSYSLAALTQAFDIPLKSHHRALCDAQAAAELLILINEKRAELCETSPP